MSREARNAALAQLEMRKSSLETQIQNVQSSMRSGNSGYTDTQGVTAQIGKVTGNALSAGNALAANAAAAQEAAKKMDEYREELKRLNVELENTTAQIEAYNAVTAEEDAAARENAFNDAVAETNKEIEHRNRLYSQTQKGQLTALEEELAFANELLDKKTVNADGTTTGYDKEKTELRLPEREKESP